jgi:hypothetical protein
MTVPMMFEDRKGYAIAEQIAAEAIASVDPDIVVAERAVDFDAEEGVFTIPFLGTNVFVSFPQGVVSGEDDRRLSGAVAILALHYLIYRGEPLQLQGWLAYRDMPGARHFESAFEDMAERRISGYFGDDPSQLTRAAATLGGTRSDTGDTSFVIPALPRVPLLVVLWGACEGVEGSSRILFKPSAPFYLHSEDLAALGAVTAERLIAVHKSRGDDV